MELEDPAPPQIGIEQSMGPREVHMPARFGNMNRLKHGLYVGHKPAYDIIREANTRPPAFAILYLEHAIDMTYAQLKEAQGLDFVRLANSLSLLVAALYNGHRTLAYLRGGLTPVMDAIRELSVLDFSQD